MQQYLVYFIHCDYKVGCRYDFTVVGRWVAGSNGEKASSVFNLKLRLTELHLVQVKIFLSGQLGMV